MIFMMFLVLFMLENNIKKSDFSAFYILYFLKICILIGEN